MESWSANGRRFFSIRYTIIRSKTHFIFSVFQDMENIYKSIHEEYL